MLFSKLLIAALVVQPASAGWVYAGSSNAASGDGAVVVGGESNQAAAENSVIGGGIANQVLDKADAGAIVGGGSNLATGIYSTVVAGRKNRAYSKCVCVCVCVPSVWANENSFLRVGLTVANMFSQTPPVRFTTPSFLQFVGSISWVVVARCALGGRLTTFALLVAVLVTNNLDDGQLRCRGWRLHEPSVGSVLTHRRWLAQHGWRSLHFCCWLQRM